MLLLLALGSGCNKQSAVPTATNTDTTNNVQPISDSETRSALPETINQLRAEAEKWDAVAQFKLGVKYYHGEDVPQDMGEVIEWFRRAAKQGIPEAQYNLGFIYHKGEGVTQNKVEAAK